MDIALAVFRNLMTEWLNQLIDPMDQQGNIRIPQRPGLGLDINWKFIEKNRVL